MSIEHISVASNSEKLSDEFFVELLGLKKTREFIVGREKMEKFFGVDEDHKLIRYANELMDVEVVITNSTSKSKDIFTHSCLIIKDRDEFVNEAETKGYKVVKVPRENSENYYMFIKDKFGNLFEIKSS